VVSKPISVFRPNACGDRCHGLAYPEPGERQDKHLQLGHGFRLALGDDGQAAQMTLGHGETEGGPDIRCAR
jgi:hypothetical protein